MFDPNSILGDIKHRRERQILEGAWRFQLVAPLLDLRLSKADRQSIRAKLVAQKHVHPWRGAISVSPRTLRRWTAQYRKLRLAGLTAHSRKDLNTSRVLPPDALQTAHQFLKEDPRRSVHLVIQMLEQTNPDWEGKVARSTLDRHLRRLGKPGKTDPDVYRSFEAADPNSSWQGDILHGPDVSHDGKVVRSKLVCWIDDYSRYVCHLEAFADERLPVVETALKRAILKHGRPARILVDNGKVYSCKSFTLACSQLGIQKIHSAPYHPQSKGKVERFFRHLREGLLNEFDNLAEPLPLDRLNRILVAFVDRYHDRLHSSIKTTPRERYQPRLHRGVTLQALEEAFWQWDIRSVSPQGKIDFHGNQYYVDLSLANRKAIVRYDPYDIARILVWQDGRILSEATPVQLRNKTKPVQKKPSGKSEIAQQFLDALEKSQVERLTQELNLIQLPEEEDEA